MDIAPALTGNATIEPTPASIDNAPAVPDAVQRTDATDATNAVAAPTSTKTPDPATPRPRRAHPSFARTSVVVPPAAAPVRGSRRVARAALCIGLMLLLALQLLLAQRDALAQSAQWRPLMATLCDVGLCTLPPWRDTTAFTMLNRNVAPIPGTRTLGVEARFRNDAPWPQAWPHLHLVLSDAQGRPAAARVFAPAEYAGDAARRPIAPGQSVDARLRLLEPEPATIAFAFDFR